MASNGIACHILIQNKKLEQVDTFPYLGSLITEDGVYDRIPYQVKRASDWDITAENIKVTAYRFQQIYD